MFQEAAKARATEAKALEEANLACGAVYLAGYVVECLLKSLLQKTGKSFPRSGRAGHDLRFLWDSAGLRSSDLRGHKKLFLDTWETSLRYEAKLPDGHDVRDLITGGQDLAKMVTVRLRRTRKVQGKR